MVKTVLHSSLPSDPQASYVFSLILLPGTACSRDDASPVEMLPRLCAHLKLIHGRFAMSFCRRSDP